MGCPIDRYESSVSSAKLANCGHLQSLQIGGRSCLDCGPVKFSVFPYHNAALCGRSVWGLVVLQAAIELKIRQIMLRKMH